jgi:hypothetical protein
VRVAEYDPVCCMYLWKGHNETYLKVFKKDKRSWVVDRWDKKE